jgi:acyl dehydratase
MPLNFDLAGKTYESVEVTVTAEQIEAYARASGDVNPRYVAGDSQIASPVFPVVPGFALMGAVTSDPALNVENPLMIVHGEQEFVYHRPIRAGDTLVLTPSLERVEDKGKGATYVTKVSARDAAGEPVTDSLATIFVRGGGSGSERPATTKPPVPEKGELIAQFDRHVDISMPARYADASGDHNPIHLDDGVAKAVGLPGVINHGLGTLSLVAGGLVDHLLGGDPGPLRRLRVRFTDMVFPGSGVSTSIWSNPLGGYLFATSRADDAVVMTGSVEVAGI